MVIVKGLKCLENSQHTAVGESNHWSSKPGRYRRYWSSRAIRGHLRGRGGCSSRELDSRGIEVSIDEVDVDNLAD